MAISIPWRRGPLSVEALRHPYAAIWSLDAPARESELADCLAHEGRLRMLTGCFTVSGRGPER